MKRDKTNDDKEEKCEMRDGREKVEEEEEGERIEGREDAG